MSPTEFRAAAEDYVNTRGDYELVYPYDEQDNLQVVAFSGHRTDCADMLDDDEMVVCAATTDEAKPNDMQTLVIPQPGITTNKEEIPLDLSPLRRFFPALPDIILQQTVQQ